MQNATYQCKRICTEKEKEKERNCKNKGTTCLINCSLNGKEGTEGKERH